MDLLRKLRFWALAAVLGCTAANAQTDSITTSNMTLECPIAGVTTGPRYATLLQTMCTTGVDVHDHTAGKGVQIPTAGLNLDANLDLNGFGPFDADFYELNQQVSETCVASTAINRMISVAGDMGWCNEDGDFIQLTNGSTINVAGVGGISGDYVSTSADLNYSDTTKLYRFHQSGALPAPVDHGGATIREESGATNGVTLDAPAGLVSSYTVTLPPALPAGDAFMSSTSGGVMTFKRALPEDWVTVCATAGIGCDYVGTDETPFTDALTAIGDGGAILVGPGTYTFTTTVTLSQDSVRITGSGRDSTSGTIITGGISADALFDVTGVHNVLEHMQIINSHDSLSWGVLLTGDNNTVRDNYIRHTSTSTTATHDAVAIMVRSNSNKVMNNIAEVAITGGASLQRACIALGSASGEFTEASVNGNLISGNGLIHATSGGVTGYGILLRAADDTGSGPTTLVHGNTIANNIALTQMDGYLIYLWSEANASALAQISENVVIGNSDAIDDSTTNTIGLTATGAGTVNVLSNLIVSNFLDAGYLNDVGVADADNGIKAVQDAQAWDGAVTVTNVDFNGEP